MNNFILGFILVGLFNFESDRLKSSSLKADILFSYTSFLFVAIWKLFPRYFTKNTLHFHSSF